ncbi:Aste57867_2562 [Aphanomyces stellatus]|uniref:Aste57867_2562 protein n=1 Tax=Aphanomyces stellatus TaxID=120398 RepID=A0A485KDI0_9STRA|nr:hypothetical protein As57867_002555 [Aphanomyces stellatus]VFT79758.1 Aste57867_2562 [Aphanomyces stellatus]
MTSGTTEHDDSGAAAPKMTTTWNGAVSHATTTSGRVDLYYSVLRGTPEARVAELMTASYNEDALHTLKLVAYLRDIRGGKGERLVARQALQWLALHHPEELEHNLKHYVAEYGRFDDLLALVETPVEAFALTVFAEQLKTDLAALEAQEPISLCAKWVPSQQKAADKKTNVNTKLAKAMGISAAELRKRYVSPLRASLKLLEQFMCAKEWDKIDLNKVPSVAMHIHSQPKKAFARHLAKKYAAWKEGLKSGKTKVNAGVLHPHQVVRQYFQSLHMFDLGDGWCIPLANNRDDLVEAQWQVMLENGRALGTLSRTLVMADVSGSMTEHDCLPLLVSCALGILISELCQDEFHGVVLTFHETPSFYHVTGTTLLDKVRCLMRAPFGLSTDFCSALRLVLTTATEKQISNDHMPERLIVISDMQFNVAQGKDGDATNFQVFTQEIAAAGYTVPQLVFWNVNGVVGDTPTLASEANVSLLSGFSPAVLKAALTGKQLTPFQTMLQAVDDARYDLIELPPPANGIDGGVAQDA